MRTACLIAIFGLCILGLCLSTAAHAAYTTFSSLEGSISGVLPMLEDFSKESSAKLKTALARDDCKFLKGHQLNLFTTLEYTGDTIALNKMMGAIAECSGVSLHVSFFRPTTPAGVAHDWAVTHTARSNELVVRINLASESIDLEKLYIPSIEGK